jgi:hypothetical protein
MMQWQIVVQKYVFQNEGISSTMTKVEMVKDIHLQMRNFFDI